jgi:M6 family metalloprotease-like protein
MFSENYWIGSGSNSPHPEEEEVFGSFKDYWLQMSKSNLRVGGQVVNPPDQNGVPLWIEANHSRDYYASFPPFSPALANEAIQEAIASGYVSEKPGDPNYYDKYAIVYAQYAIFSGALMVNGSGNGKYHFLAERSGPQLYGGDLSEKSFTHIGIYDHEFGHTIGLCDEYSGRDDGRTDLRNFCLMGWGIYNGPSRKASCPATLSPYYRISYGWISEPIQIESDATNFLVEYDYNNPKLYKIVPPGITNGMHYLFEVRKRQGFDTYIPEPPETFQNQAGTLLIWQQNISNSYGYSDRIRLKTADFSSTDLSQLEDFFPASIYQNNQNLNDLTYPMASIGADLEEEFPNLIKPAHFALNGIQKLSNGNTVINEVRPNQATIKNQNSGDWQTMSVPVGYNNYLLSTIFPTALFAYKFVNNTYVQVNTLVNGIGYWVLFPHQIQNLVNAGTVIEHFEIPVNFGWNIIGTISDKVPRPNVCSQPLGIINSIYKYVAGVGYILIQQSDSLIPGIGYWTLVNNPGNIILDRFAGPCGIQKSNSVSDIDLTTLDKFIITDANGNSQSLYVSNTDIDTTMRNIEMDLPPLFSELPFDSRFEYDEFVKKVSIDSGTVDLSILVHSNSFPVSLIWEINPENGINYSFLCDSGLGKTSSISTTKGSAKFNNLDNNKIQLFASADKVNSLSVLPTGYSLEQNFPNPFNPATTIKYALKNDGRVTLKIFNILGEEIKTMVDEVKSAGYYQIDFNASSLASGVYIYKIQAGAFLNSKKMILLK